jgi:hypothetical protein
MERPRLYGPPVDAWRDVPLLLALHTAAANNFCLWSYEQRAAAGDEPTWTKVPRRLRGGVLVNAQSNADEWMGIDEAFTAWRTRPLVDIHGLGFMLHGSGVVFIDLDGAAVRSDPFVLAPWARQLVEAIPAYWEISPSGWGLKGWALGEVSFSGRRHILHSVEQTAPMAPAIELWSDKKYGCVTCRHLPDTALEPPNLQRHLDRLVERYFAPRARAAPPNIGPSRVNVARGARALSDEDWLIQRARAAANGDKFRQLFDRGDTSGYPSASEADLALAGIIGFWTKDVGLLERVMRRSALVRPKWDESTYLELTLSRAQTTNGSSFGGEPPPSPEEDARSYPEPEDRGLATLSPQGGKEHVADLLRPGRILVVAAEEGSGKSYAIDDELGIRVACAGGSFAETWPVVRTGNVLVLSEMHTDDDFEREDVVLHSLELDRAALGGKYYRLPLMTAAHGQPPLDDPGWRSWCVEWCRTHHVIALIVDTATGATEAEPWGKDIRAVYRNLRLMLAEYPELAIVLVVHCKKPQGSGERGISDVIGEWGRWCDVVLMLERDGPTRTKLTSYKRVKRPRKLVAEQKDGLLVDPVDIAAGGPVRKVSPQAVVAAVAENPGLTYVELAEKLDISKDTASRYVKLGIAAEDLLEREEGPRKTRHVYPTAASPQTTASPTCGGGSGTQSTDHRSTPPPYIGGGGAAAVVPQVLERSDFEPQCEVCGQTVTTDSSLCDDCEREAEPPMP